MFVPHVKVIRRKCVAGTRQIFVRTMVGTIETRRIPYVSNVRYARYSAAARHYLIIRYIIIIIIITAGNVNEPVCD